MPPETPSVDLSDPNDSTAGLVPYDDLQVSPGPKTGHFGAAFDIGTLTVSDRPYHVSRPAAVIHIREHITPLGARETLVSLGLPEE